MNGAGFCNQIRHVRAHLELKIRILACFFSEDFQEEFLVDHQYVGVFCFEAAKIKRSEGAVGGLNDRRKSSPCLESLDPFGQDELVEDFQSGGVDGVATESAVEIFVHLEKHDADPPAR